MRKESHKFKMQQDFGQPRVTTKWGDQLLSQLSAGVHPDSYIQQKVYGHKSKMK